MTIARASHLIQIDPQTPEAIQLLPAGEFRGRDGRGPYLNDDPAGVLAEFERWGMPLLIDYHHQTQFASNKTGPVPAAGWGRALAERAGEIWATVEWTPRAAEAIQQRELLYISPVFDYSKKTGRVLRVIGAALLNDPNLCLRAVAARDFPEESHVTTNRALCSMMSLAEESDDATIIATVQSMIDEATRAKEALARLAAFVSLSAGAAWEEISQAIEGRLAADPDPARYIPRAQFDAVAGELASLQRTAHHARVDAAVTGAMQAGKIPPALENWARAYAGRDPAGFDAYVAAAPVLAGGAATVKGPPPNTGAPPDPGDIEVFERHCRAQWDGDPAVRQEFPTFSVYHAYERAAARGQVRILGVQQ